MLSPVARKMLRYQALFSLVYVVAHGWHFGWWGGEAQFGDFAFYYEASQRLKAGESLTGIFTQYRAEIAALLGGQLPSDQFTNPVPYPPHYFILLLPLAWLPLHAAFALWIGFSLLVWGCVMRSKAFQQMWLGSIIAKEDKALYDLACLCNPFVALCIASGQNGMLIAALVLYAFAQQQRKPLTSGALMAITTIKPHLAALLPLHWVLMRHGRALVAALVSFGLLVALSALLFSPESWLLMPEMAESFSAFVLSRVGPQEEAMLSLFNSLRLLGMPPALALKLHGACGLLGLVVYVVLLFRGYFARSGVHAPAFFLLLCCLLPPYIMIYDTLFLWPLVLICLLQGRDGAGMALLLLALPVARAAYPPFLVLAPWLLMALAAWFLLRRDTRIPPPQAQ